MSDAKAKDADVIFIGDSILQALEHTEVWNQWFAPLHCLNFSIHNDQTQNVLWRIKNGELDHVEAKVRLFCICGCYSLHLALMIERFTLLYDKL